MPTDSRFALPHDSESAAGRTIMEPSFQADKSTRRHGVWNGAVTISPFEKGADALAGAPVLVVEDERDLAEELASNCRQAAIRRGSRRQSTTPCGRPARAPPFWSSIACCMARTALRSLKRCAAKATPRRRWLISALSSVDERINGLKAGDDDYLVKPFDIRELTGAAVSRQRDGGRDSRA